ncbi:MAG: hypothetical protein A3F68_13355 [Acidobacteria bacterium RIFCSPLOWO2_12_FULL_54_10]|nr:MAG: hypothetical protein A3F68_13355 [Acidobacteria bacterium RIFCSPLOWO2_12_FULL_54_10]
MIRVNLLGLPKQRKKAAHALPTISMEGSRALVLLVIVLVAVAGFQYYRHRGLQSEGAVLATQLQDLERERADLSRIKEEYDRFSQRKELLTRRIGIIEELKARQTGPIKLLDVFASTVAETESLWLLSFEQAGEKISIEGETTNARAVADFMTRLFASQAFATVELAETLQDAGNKDAVRFLFRLEVQLKPSPPASTSTEQSGPA